MYIGFHRNIGECIGCRTKAKPLEIYEAAQGPWASVNAENKVMPLGMINQVTCMSPVRGSKYGFPSPIVNRY